MIPNPLPTGRTARRLEWAHLPPPIRHHIEKRIGTRVVESHSQGAGFTPGFASVLVGADGSRHFVKAASTVAQRLFADSYRVEAVRLRTLPPGTPAPRLLWNQETEDWVLLGIEYVDGRGPSRPWASQDLAACSQMLIDCASALTPAPGIGVATAAEEFASWPALWSSIDHPRAEEYGALAARYAEVMGGNTLVHCDVRDDNILMLTDGSAVICDWNWPVVGAAWLDSLMLLIGPRGDGLDVDGFIAGHPLLRDVPAEHIDIALALWLGYFTASANLPHRSNSPYLRQAQGWQREVIDHWLAARRVEPSGPPNGA